MLFVRITSVLVFVSVEDTYNENLSDTEIIDNTIEVDFLNYTPWT